MSDLSIQYQTALAQAQAASAQTSSAAQSGGMTAEEAQAFSETLAQEMALLQAAEAGTASANANPLAAYMPTLLQSTAGQSLESQILMLLMMMTTGQADASSMMAVLAQAVSAMQEQSEKERLRRTIMDSSYDNSLLDAVNDGVFGGSAANYPYEAWKACDPTVTSDATDRSAALYAQVIAQFGVETNARYANNKKGTGDTYCNIFLWDVTSAMGAEIPHYVDAATGAPRTYPDVTGATELNANAIYRWLEEHGRQYGWIEVTPEVAQAHANQGGPAVTSWYNSSGGSGHVQIVRPAEAGEAYDAERGPAIAQAGSKLLESATVRDVFSERAMAQLKYYIHL